MTFEDWQVDNSGFSKWYAGHAKRLGLNPDPDDPRHHYDYRAAYKAGVKPPTEKGGHWSSEFKLPGHPRMVVGGINTKTGKPVDGFEAWKKPPGRLEQAEQAVTEAVAAPVRTLESMIGSIGGIARMQVEELASTGRMGRWAKMRKGAAPTLIAAEHLIRKYGPEKAVSFYDKKMKGLAEGAQRFSDFWEEQANKGWEAPNPDIVEARWRDKPVSKAVSAVSSGLTSVGVVVGTSVLTGQPQLGLLALAGSETGAMYSRLRDKDVDPAVASQLAQMAGAWTYVTEKIGFKHLLAPGKRTIFNVLKKAGWEGGQEVIEQMGHNLLEYFGYDWKDTKSIPSAIKAGFDHLMDNWLDSLVAGVGVGGLVHVAIGPRGEVTEPVEPGAVEGEVVYHGTSEGATLRIQKEGLKVRPVAEGIRQVSFSEDIQGAESFAKRKSPGKEIVLRIKTTKDITIDERISTEKGQRDFKSLKDVPVENIEVRTPEGEWIPLTSYDIITKKPLAQPPAPEAPVEPGAVEGEVKYTKAGETVDGRKVLKDVSNMDSIDASLTDYEIIEGIQEIPMSEFEALGKKSYSVTENKLVDDLAEQIKESGEIAPIIAVQDKGGLYILEGGHRADALFKLGAKSIPAVVVKDLESLAQPPAPEVTPPTVEQLTGKTMEEIAPQTADHAIGHQYGLTNEQVDNKLGEAELRYRELKQKDAEERTQKEIDDLAFLSRNRTNLESLLERETQPPVLPKAKRSRKQLLALGHKIARDAELTDEDYRDFAEIVVGKRSMGDMTRKEMDEFVLALEESFGEVKELSQEDYDISIQVAGKPTTMRQVFNAAVKAVTDLKNIKTIPSTIKLGFGRISAVQRLKNFFFGIDNTPPYHLARILDGGEEGVFSEVLDKGIEYGRKITAAHTRSVMRALKTELEDADITDDDLAKMGKSVNPRMQTHQMISEGAATEIFTVEINGKNYEMTMANLIEIYLIAKQKDGIRHLTKGGMVVNGVETGKLSVEQINALQQRVEADPKAKAVADAILKVGELIWKPSINQVSTRIEGKDIATINNWWGLEVFMPRRIAGKVRVMGKLGQFSLNLIENKSIFHDRTKSTAPLVIRDVFRRFSVFESAIAEYVGMAEASRTSRTILNDPRIATALDQKGYGSVRDRILAIHTQAQSLPASEGNFSAWFAKRLPGLYRAVLYFNPRVVASQFTSAFNYGAYASMKYLANIKDGLDKNNALETKELSDIAWDRFHMGHSSLELGEMTQSDAALRMWTGGRSSDINKAGWAMKIADLAALAAGMKIAQEEYQDARGGTIEGFSDEWWAGRENLPEADIKLWKKVQEAGEEADPDEKAVVEAWRKIVTERAEYLWQRTQPSWDKWNRSLLTSQKGVRRLFLLFRSFHEKSLTIFNEAKLDYENSPKTHDDKVRFAQRTGSVLTGYTVNMFLRLMIMALITRELKEPTKYFEEFLTSWTAMFPIFGRVLKTSVNRFVDAVTGARPTYTGEPVESYPVRVVNMVLKSPTDFTQAVGHVIEGDNEAAEKAFERGMKRLVEGVGTLSGIPIPEIKRVLPDEEKKSTGQARPARRR